MYSCSLLFSGLVCVHCTCTSTRLFCYLLYRIFCIRYFMCMCWFYIIFFFFVQCSSLFCASPFYMVWWLLLLHSLVFRFPSIWVDSFAQKHRGNEQKKKKKSTRNEDRTRNELTTHNSAEKICPRVLEQQEWKKKSVYNVHTFTYVIKMYTRIQGNEGKKQRTKTNEKKKNGNFSPLVTCSSSHCNWTEWRSAIS